MSEQINYFPSNLDSTTRSIASARQTEQVENPGMHSLHSLATEITQRVRQPIDSLEVTALLESHGITNEVATRRYGARDVFELAEAVFERLRASGLPTSSKQRQPDPPLSVRQTWADYARGPMAVGAVFVLLLIMAAYRQLGQWGQNQVLALSLGMMGSMLVTNGFVQVASRRGAIFLSRGNPSAASAFLQATLLLAGVCCVVVAGLSAVVAAGSGLFAPEDTVIFVLAFVGFSVIWLIAAALSLAQVPGWLGLGLAAGLATGLVVDRVLSLFSPIHLLVGTAVGFAVSVGLMLRAAHHAIYAVAHKNAQRGPVTLPTVAYLAYEATPYFAYGLLYIVFIFMPHIIGWAGVVPIGQTRIGAVSTLEFALTLSLVPLMLTSGVVEQSMRQFWGRARTDQLGTPGEDPDQFGHILSRFYWRQLAVYLTVLALTSLVVNALFLASLKAGLITHWLQLDDQVTLLFMFQTSLAAYFLLGWGLFNCIFSVTLARPELALRAVILGAVVTASVGLPLSLVFSFSLAPIGFVAGAFAFVVASTRAVVRLFRSADYYYYASF